MGVFEVELTITNSDPNCFERKSVFIQVKCPVVADFVADATELEVGEVFTATNSSQNATNFEWWVNGVLVSTSIDLGYIFSNAGTYTILLQAIGPYCAKGTSGVVQVVDDGCPDSTTIFFYNIDDTLSGLKFLETEDILSNGDRYLNAYHSGLSNHLYKTSPTGEVLWGKKIGSPVSGSLYVSATTDGGALCHYRKTPLHGMTLFKTDSQGNTEWGRQSEGARVSCSFANGSGGLLFSQGYNPNRFGITFLNANGDVTNSKLYDLEAGFNFCGYDYSVDSSHIWAVGNAVSPLGAIEGGIVLKLDTLGNLQWVKQYNDTAMSPLSFRGSTSYA